MNLRQTRPTSGKTQLERKNCGKEKNLFRREGGGTAATDHLQTTIEFRSRRISASFLTWLAEHSADEGTNCAGFGERRSDYFSIKALLWVVTASASGSRAAGPRGTCRKRVLIIENVSWDFAAERFRHAYVAIQLAPPEANRTGQHLAGFLSCISFCTVIKKTPYWSISSRCVVPPGLGPAGDS